MYASITNAAGALQLALLWYCAGPAQRSPVHSSHLGALVSDLHVLHLMLSQVLQALCCCRWSTSSC